MNRYRFVILGFFAAFIGVLIAGAFLQAEEELVILIGSGVLMVGNIVLAILYYLYSKRKI